MRRTGYACRKAIEECSRGGEKERRAIVEQGQHNAAKYNDRGCVSCNAVIPFGQSVGPHGECPACVGALKEDG